MWKFLAKKDRRKTPRLFFWGKTTQNGAASLTDMSDELLMKIFRYLDIQNITKLSQTSKRFNAICEEEILWQKAEIQTSKLPSIFVEKLLKKGCKDLSLYKVKVKRNLDLKTTSQLKSLILSNCKIKQGMEQLLTLVHSLKRLCLLNLTLKSNVIEKISNQNSQTLQMLNLRWCTGRSSKKLK